MLQVSHLGKLFARSKVGATLYLSVGAQTLHAAVYAQGEWQRESIVELPFQAGAGGAKNSALEGLLDSLQLLQQRLSADLVPRVLAQGHADVCVSISTRWLPNETLPWSDIMGTVGLRAVATDYLQHSGFAVELQDVVCWEDSPWGSSRWVLAYPATIMQALEQLASAMGGRLVSLLPAVSLVAQWFVQQRARTGMVGYVESGLLYLVEVEDGYVQSTMQRALDDAAMESEDARLTEGVSRLWHGIRLRTPHLHEATELAVLFESDSLNAENAVGLRSLVWPQPTQSHIVPLLRTLRIVQKKRNALDAVKVRASFGGMNLFFLVASSVVVLALVLLAIFNFQTIHRLESAQQAAHSPVVQSVPIVLSKAQKDQVLAINSAIRQLNMPVAELLRALNPPQDIRVALLGIDLIDDDSDAGLPKLKLSAEALSGEDMTRYVGFLDGRRPFVQASLVRHEVMQNVSESPWRFTMELTWRP